MKDNTILENELLVSAQQNITKIGIPNYKLKQGTFTCPSTGLVTETIIPYPPNSEGFEEFIESQPEYIKDIYNKELDRIVCGKKLRTHIYKSFYASAPMLPMDFIKMGKKTVNSRVYENMSLHKIMQYFDSQFITGSKFGMYWIKSEKPVEYNESNRNKKIETILLKYVTDAYPKLIKLSFEEWKTIENDTISEESFCKLGQYQYVPLLNMYNSWNFRIKEETFLLRFLKIILNLIKTSTDDSKDLFSIMCTQHMDLSHLTESQIRDVIRNLAVVEWINVNSYHGKNTENAIEPKLPFGKRPFWGKSTPLSSFKVCTTPCSVFCDPFITDLSSGKIKQDACPNNIKQPPECNVKDGTAYTCDRTSMVAHIIDIYKASESLLFDRVQQDSRLVSSLKKELDVWKQSYISDDDSNNIYDTLNSYTFDEVEDMFTSTHEDLEKDYMIFREKCTDATHWIPVPNDEVVFYWKEIDDRRPVHMGTEEAEYYDPNDSFKMLFYKTLEANFTLDSTPVRFETVPVLNVPILMSTYIVCRLNGKIYTFKPAPHTEYHKIFDFSFIEKLNDFIKLYICLRLYNTVYNKIYNVANKKNTYKIHHINKMHLIITAVLFAICISNLETKPLDRLESKPLDVLSDTLSNTSDVTANFTLPEPTISKFDEMHLQIQKKERMYNDYNMWSRLFEYIQSMFQEFIPDIEFPDLFKLEFYNIKDVLSNISRKINVDREWVEKTVHIIIEKPTSSTNLTYEHYMNASHCMFHPLYGFNTTFRSTLNSSNLGVYALGHYIYNTLKHNVLSTFTLGYPEIVKIQTKIQSQINRTYKPITEKIIKILENIFNQNVTKYVNKIKIKSDDFVKKIESFISRNKPDDSKIQEWCDAFERLMNECKTLLRTHTFVIKNISYFPTVMKDEIFEFISKKIEITQTDVEFVLVDLLHKSGIYDLVNYVHKSYKNTKQDKCFTMTNTTL